ncbi:MAG TPA: hypothetical protein PLW70_00150 [Bacteroidales bacterium]|nr:hypothetical protein [Bacteroidales bacterium]
MREVEEWLSETTTALIENYNRLGLRASGEWEQSLKGTQEETETGVKVIILGAKYTEQLSIGRRPGKMPPRQAILNWIREKNIQSELKPQTLAYLIQRKIGRDGIKVPNRYNAGGLVSDVLTNERINELIKNVGNVVLREQRSDILISLKNGSK